MTTPNIPGNEPAPAPDDQTSNTVLLSLAADWQWSQDRALRLTRLHRTGALDDDFLAAAAGGTFEAAGWLPLDDDTRRALAAAVEHTQPYRDLILAHESDRYISISGTPIRNDRGEWQGYQGIAKDVTTAQRQHIERRWLGEILDASPDVIMVADGSTGRLVYTNEIASERLGLTHDEIQALPSHTLAGLDHDQLMTLYEAVRASGTSGLATERQLRASADGTRRGWWEPHWRSVRVDDRELIITVSREVSRQVISEREAERAKRMYATLSATNEAILRLQSPQALYQAVCDAATSEGGFAAAGVLLPQPGTDTARLAAFRGAGSDVLRDTPVSLDADRTTGQGLVGTAYRTGRPAISDDYAADTRTTPWQQAVQAAGVKSVAAIPIHRKDRIVGVLLLSATERRAFDTEVVTLLERMSANIGFALTLLEHETERRKAEERVRFLANHDNLTGLPNRMLFHQLLAEALQTARTDGTGVGVMFLDLDRFKIINDSLGHAAGDKLLRALAERLTVSMRESDVIARLGGDEFVVLLRDVGRVSDIAVVAERILAATMEPILVDGQECRISASVGVALYPDHADDENRLMKFADIAMYLAKEDGRNAWRLYSPTVRAEAIERLTLESELRIALEQDQFQLYFQAKYNVDDGAMTGAEALLRWRHPRHGVLAPGHFMNQAEEMGLAVPLGRWVVRTVCRQFRAWREAGLEVVPVSINVSSQQFYDENFPLDLRDALAANGMRGADLELEITEAMLMRGPEAALSRLQALKAVGVRITMDDFGIGYATLAQITPFPVDGIKVATTFVHNLPHSAHGREMTQAIVDMARALKLQVVAKGVETAEQHQIVGEIACDQTQGYYFDRPAPPETFAERLRVHTD